MHGDERGPAGGTRQGCVWRITGNPNPGAKQRFPWLSGTGCVRVWPDDRIEPTDDEADPS